MENKPASVLNGILTKAATNKKSVKRAKKLLVQYEVSGNTFFPTGAIEVVDKLGPGVYEIGSSPQGIFLKIRDVNTDTLLRLPDTKSEEVITEIEKFWTLKEKFDKFGYLHKRGFLLYGPPGAGKTSTISMICKDMVEGGGIILLGGQPAMLASMLQMIREIEPDRKITVILEDIDTLIGHHGENAMLSLLDGEHSVGGVVYVATTNYPEQLPERIIDRPSRFDRTVEIGFPSPAAREVYFRSRGLTEDMDKWVAVSDGFSIAHMKELIVGVHCLGDTLEKVAARLAAMAKKVTSTRRKFKLPTLNLLSVPETAEKSFESEGGFTSNGFLDFDNHE